MTALLLLLALAAPAMGQTITFSTEIAHEVQDINYVLFYERTCCGCDSPTLTVPNITYGSSWGGMGYANVGENLQVAQVFADLPTLEAWIANHTAPSGWVLECKTGKRWTVKQEDVWKEVEEVTRTMKRTGFKAKLEEKP